MANARSSHARRPSRVMSAVLAYGYVFVVLSMMGGVLVGFAIMAFDGGLSSDIQWVIGIILLIDGLLAGVTGLFFSGLRLGSRRAARSPKRDLLVSLLPQGRGVEVSGTIVSAPVELAPLSQCPCVVWHVALLERHEDAYADPEFSSPVQWITVWSQSRIADVEIRYDRARTMDIRPDARDHRPTVTDSPGGTITIPGGAIQLKLIFSRSRRTFPPTTANLLILDRLGLPAELREKSARFPNAYRVVEYRLTTGDFVSGHQQSAIASERWLPDPNAPFEISDISREQANTWLLGCLAGSFIAGMLILLGLGYAFLQR